MSQHDQVIANSDGATVRADINSALAAIFGNSSGATTPGTTIAYMYWVDTTSGTLKRRNAANTGWIIVGTIDEARVVDRGSNTILDESDYGKTFRATASFTQTLTAAATLADGWWCAFRIEEGAVITFDPNASENINGATTFAVTGPASGFIFCNGTAFYTVGFNRISQVVFPATQVASSDANTLDDYQEFTWTPVLTFTTPGDLNVVYSVQSGTGTKIGNRVELDFHIETSTFTHSTASGNCQITGAPDSAVSLAGSINFVGSMIWAGITKASYTQVNPRISDATATILLVASGSGQAASAVTTANMPTTGSVVLDGHISYPAAT